MHYNWAEWANAFVAQKVLRTELDLLCDSHASQHGCKEMADFDVQTRFEIVMSAMRWWPAYRHDAILKVAARLQASRHVSQ